MAADLSATLIVLGRILLGGLFVLGGIKHFFAIGPISGVMATRGVPQPTLVLVAGSIWQIAFGALFIAGLWLPFSVAGLVVFTIAATVMFLNFWDVKEEPARETLKNMFLTNVALIGGLLIAAAG